MTDDEPYRNTVPAYLPADPDAGFCIGCGRTVREVFLWFDMSEDARAEVAEALPGRLASLPPERRA